MHRVVINQSVEQIQQLRQSIQGMVTLGVQRNQYIQQLRYFERQGEVRMDMRQLKLLLCINLQRIILTLKQANQHSISAIQSTYSMIIKIEQEEGHISNEKLINYKVIQAVLDYRVSQDYGFQRNFYFEELLPVIEEKGYQICFHQKNNQQYTLYFLGLIIQFLKKKELQNYIEAYGSCVKYQKQKIQRLKKQQKLYSRQIFKQLQILINTHLGYKLLRKHFKLKPSPFDDQSLFILLYQLDESFNQRITLQYKKLYSKEQDEALNFVAEKTKSFFMDLQQSVINRTPLYSFTSKAKQFNIRRTSKQSIKSIPKQRSLKQLKQDKLRINNNMFVPQKVNPNKQLQHRQQHRIQSNKLQIINANPTQFTMKNINIRQAQDNPSQPQASIRSKSSFRLSTQQKQKVSYSQCIREIRGASKQLQQMLCHRPANKNRLSFESKQSAQRRDSCNKSSTKSKVKRLNSKMTIRNMSNLNEGEQNMATNKYLQSDDLFIPPIVKKVIHAYLSAFCQQIKYDLQRKNVPYYSQFSQLHLNKYYYLASSIFQFTSIQQENLIFYLNLRKLNGQKRALSINLLSDHSMDNIKSTLKSQKGRLHLFELFYFGPQISLFKLNLKFPGQNSEIVKHEVKQIKYENEIYAYNIYLNTATLSNKLIRKVIKRQQQLMQSLNKDLQIQFDYNQSQIYKQPNPINFSSSLVKFHQFFHSIHQKCDNNFIFLQSQIKSLMVDTIFHLFYIQLYRELDSQKYYLVLYNHNYNRFVLSCKKISIQKLFQYVRTIKQLKQVVITNKILKYSSWSHVILNQSILQAPFKKYCLRNDSSYKIFYSKWLVQGKIKLIYGCNDKRWFTIVPVQIQPFCVKTAPKGRNSRKNLWRGNGRQVKGQQGMQMLVVERMKYMKMGKYQLEYNSQSYKIFSYEYSWIYYQNDKNHYCFKNNKSILDYTVSLNGLLYVNKVTLNRWKSKQSIFQTYKRSLSSKQSLLIKTLSEFGQIIKISLKDNNFIINLALDDNDTDIIIDSSQFTFFEHPKFKMKHKFLKSKQFRRRLIHVMQGKLRQLNYSIIY